MPRLFGKFLGNTVGNAASFSVGVTAGRTLTPVVQDLVNEAWQTHPSLPVQPQAVAQGVAEGVIPYQWGEDEAARSGINTQRFAYMVSTARNAPATSELFALRNRETINDAKLADGLEQNGIRQEWREALATLRRVLPSVTDQVRFAVREVYNPAQRAALDLDAEFPDAFAAEAAKVGLAREDAADYWAAHWELPSYEQGANMMFRGDLTADQFSGLLKALDYAPTWRDKLANLARAIPPISDMIRFAVREVYDPAKRSALGLDDEYPAEFTGQAAKHGMAEEDARDYWAAHWNLPSATQGYHMLWRDEINEAQLDELLKALDYSTQWRTKLRNIAYLVPGRIDLRRMYAEDLIGYPELVHGYKRLGYNDADAKTLADFAVKLANKTKAGTGQSFPQKAQGQLWTTTHRSFMSGESTDAVVLDKLATVGVPATDRDDVLRVWKEERELIRKQLTPAQVKKAWTKAVTHPLTGQPWTRDDALAELLARGYNIDDANAFLDQ